MINNKCNSVFNTALNNSIPNTTMNNFAPNTTMNNLIKNINNKRYHDDEIYDKNKKQKINIEITSCRNSGSNNNRKGPNKKNGSNNTSGKKNNNSSSDFDDFDDLWASIILGLNTKKHNVVPDVNDDPKPDDKCLGKLCDHDVDSTNIPPIPERLLDVNIGYKIKLQDLIDLGLCYHCKLQKVYRAVSLERLAKMHDSLDKLQKMIGMKIIKESFAEQIVYFLLDLEPNPTEMLHTILEGPPGVGKTLVVDILSEIYLNLGYLKKNVVNKVKINDLKGQYVGHTAPLTQKAIDDAMGGILVIDEAYSLGSIDHLDSFSKELIDTLNRNLSENAGKFVCIIAGYSDQIEKCLFSHNVGLRSRFRFRFVVDKYNSRELYEIFLSKIGIDKWELHSSIDKLRLQKFFDEKYESFKYYGRDMETLLYHTKVAHSNRIFFDVKENIGKITNSDITMGYDRFIMHASIKNSSRKDNDIFMPAKHMYI